MKKFLIKLIFYLSPIIFTIGLYTYKDPFKVIYHYDAFYGVADTNYFSIDDDYVSTQTLIQNYYKYNYDSYIFGSSRSDNYFVSEYGKHVGSNKCYHFDAAFESLYGVERKMQFLNQRKYKINNALIIIDNELLQKTKNENEPICLKHPLLSGQNKIAFQLEFLNYFFNKNFLLAYYDLIFSGHLKPYMVSSGVMRLIAFHYDVSSNEYYWANVENDIANNKYYKNHDFFFYKRDSILHYGKPVIGIEQIKLLNSIKSVLADNHTNYKIVISPLYNQLKFDTTGLKKLQNLFGKQHVFDFSGINEMTNDKYNYYESSHYRPLVCTKIMNIIYKN